MDLFAIAATLAGVTAGIVLTTPKSARTRGEHPGDVIKELWHGMISSGRSKKEDFLRGVQKEGNDTYKLGFTPMFVMYGTTLLFKVITYNHAYTNHIITTPENKLILYKAILFSGMTGVITDVCSNPYDIIRTKMYLTSEMQSNSSCHTMQEHINTPGAMFKHLGKTHGYGILCTGLTACIPRGFISSSTHIFSYVIAKQMLAERQIFRSDITAKVSASVIGASVSCFCTSPFDLVISRLHTQPLYVSGRGLLYKGVVDCFKKTYRKEGIWVFYKDFGITCLKVCPYTAVSLLLWDFFTHGNLKLHPDYMHFSQ